MVEKIEKILEVKDTYPTEDSCKVRDDFYEAESKSRRDELLGETGYLCDECHACNNGCYMCQY